MISILIPIYNCDVKVLAKDLLASCHKANVEFEIIFIDDASSLEFQNLNVGLRHLEKIQYFILPHNIGRSAIRNVLARKSSFDHLLFLDCDGVLLNDDFIKSYVPFLKQNIVVSGGRLYPNKSFPDCELHWTYGTLQESKSTRIRNAMPYKYFHSNNFLVPKNILLQYPFDESIVTYGFEDTLWAMQLSEQKINILHIDNPVLHQGLETNSVYLAKTKMSIENLVLLNLKGIVLDTGMEQIYFFLNRIKSNRLVFYIINKFQRPILKQLCTARPSLFLFQMYKLGLYLELRNNSK